MIKHEHHRLQHEWGKSKSLTLMTRNTHTNLLVSMEKPAFHTGNKSCGMKHASWEWEKKSEKPAHSELVCPVLSSLIFI